MSDILGRTYFRYVREMLNTPLSVTWSSPSVMIRSGLTDAPFVGL